MDCAHAQMSPSPILRRMVVRVNALCAYVESGRSAVCGASLLIVISI